MSIEKNTEFTENNGENSIFDALFPNKEIDSKFFIGYIKESQEHKIKHLIKGNINIQECLAKVWFDRHINNKESATFINNVAILSDDIDTEIENFRIVFDKFYVNKYSNGKFRVGVTKVSDFVMKIFEDTVNEDGVNKYIKYFSLRKPKFDAEKFIYARIKYTPKICSDNDEIAKIKSEMAEDEFIKYLLYNDLNISDKKINISGFSFEEIEMDDYILAFSELVDDLKIEVIDGAKFLIWGNV